MRIIILLRGFFTSMSSTYAAMPGIHIELSRDRQEQTLDSIRAGYLIDNDRDNVTVMAAAKLLHNLKFDKDGKFAVIHSKDAIP